MQILETLAGDVRIDLRRRQVAVTKQHLHDAQVGTVIEQMGRKRVAQRVRRAPC
jgi:hypothetical protein